MKSVSIAILFLAGALHAQAPAKHITATTHGTNSPAVAEMKDNASIVNGEVQKQPDAPATKKADPAVKPIPAAVVKPMYQHHLDDIQALMRPHLDELKKLQDEQNEVMTAIKSDNPDYDMVQTPAGAQLVPKAKPDEPKK